ncbi:MAG TPA: MmcQ/YjbR family DNA-binding protein [Vicinamibacteria bacterium]|jgi:predicted DNA-binding protein (MmcQ/YjbR family)
MNPEKVLARLRKICLSLPEAYETTSFGHPTFRAGSSGKGTFAVFENYRGEDTICFKATLADQSLLVLDPRFFVAPYIGKHGWTSMRTGGGVDFREVEDLVRESYRLAAPKTLSGKLDGLHRLQAKKRTKKK